MLYDMYGEMNSFHFIMKQSVAHQTQSADLVIKPDLSKFNRSNMEQVQELINKGYQEAKHVFQENFDYKSNWLSSTANNITKLFNR